MRRLRFAGLALLGFGLCSCVEATNEMVAVEGRHADISAREGADVGKATVAFVAADGAPSAAVGAFLEDLRASAAEKNIVVTDAKAAKYLVQAYLSGERTEGGAEYGYALEIFGADKKRARRLDDAVALSAPGDDLWGPPSAVALKQLAAQGADDLYAFLSNTTEATVTTPPKAAVVSAR